MKRNLALILAAVIAASMISCGGAGDTTDTTDTSAVSGSDTTAAVTESVQVDTTKPAGMLYADFADFVAANPAATAEEIAAHLCANENLPFSPASMQITPGNWISGFDLETVDGFVDCWSFQPMIGAIPFVGYIFEVEDANVDSFKETLVANHNMAWNVCTMADDLLCESIGNKIFFVMAPATFEEEPIDDLG